MSLPRLLALLVMVIAVSALPAWAAPKADPHDHASDKKSEGGADAAHAASSPNPLVVDPNLAIYSLIIFLILLGVLTKFAWKPIMQGLDAREHAIVSHIDSAKQSHEDAKRLLAEYEGKLAGAQDQIRHLMDEARKSAEHVAAEITTQAKASAQQELVRAKQEISNATDAALKTLAEHHANQAVALASKILGKELRPQEHQRLIDEALAKFPTIEPSKN